MDRLRFDATTWTARDGAWYDANNGCQHEYTSQPGNVAVTLAGVLAITARHDGRGSKPYTSGRVDTKDHYAVRPGSYVEALITLPLAAGAWPAFWALGFDEDAVGWPACGEIDVFEFYPASGTSVWRTLHQPNVNGVDVPYGSAAPHSHTDLGKLAGAPHLYGYHADANGVRFYIDRVLVQTVARSAVEAAGGVWEFAKPQALLLNIAVGGTALTGGTPDPAQFPTTMLVSPPEVWPPGTPMASLPAYGTLPSAR